jgi:hypothetical protein
MPTRDPYGRVSITAAELDEQAESFRQRLETVPIIRPVWNPQTLSMQLQPTTHLKIKP